MEQKQIQIIPIENRIKPDIFLMKVLMTPDLAKDFLSKMASNRSPSLVDIKKISDSIKNGFWNPENGSTIKFNSSGKLIDGQHRLKAVIHSETSIEMYVSFNCKGKAIESIDTGRSRKLSDILKINKVKYPTYKGYIIKSESVFKKNRPSMFTGNESDLNSFQRILQIARENEEYLDFICQSSSKFSKEFPVITMTYYARIYNILNKISPNKALDFFKQLTGNTDSFCIKSLKSILIKDASKKIGKMTPIEKEAALINTWNTFYNEETKNVLKWKGDLKNYPKLSGIENAKNLFD